MEKNQIMLKEIDLVEKLIERMSSNSFKIKGWALSLIIGTLLLKTTNNQAWLAIIPLISFWYLDAFFLTHERKYRKLYEWIIQNRQKSNEFIFDLSTERFKKEIGRIYKQIFSKTLVVFYLPIGITIVIYLCFFL